MSVSVSVSVSTAAAHNATADQYRTAGIASRWDACTGPCDAFVPCDAHRRQRVAAVAHRHVARVELVRSRQGA